MYKAFCIIICSISGAVAHVNNSVIHVNAAVNNVTELIQNVTSSELKLSTKISTTVQGLSIVERQTEKTPAPHFLMKIHKTITRSKDAVWATITLTFICVLLLVAVAQSRMWKDYRGPESQGVPLPNFNERVLFRDVMEHRFKSLKQIFQKKKKPKIDAEMVALLPPGEWDDESSDIPVP
ncbi:unnamed protein product [Larinioides sclopetarius]|uniref:Uncharacterized protein n=1 Tax=Larinioides sclopetarius TaxID=280406 RepID=A0AAV2B9V6_9ARAC